MTADVRARREIWDLKGEPSVSVALARGASIEDAARAGSVSARTVRRRLEDPRYRAEIAKLRAKVLDGILARLLYGARVGVETLIEVARDGKSESARVSAARVLAEHTLSFSELVAVDERLAAIEAAVSEAAEPVLTIGARE